MSGHLLDMGGGGKRCWALVIILHIVLLSSTIGLAAGSTQTARPWERHLRSLKPSSPPRQQEDAVRGLLKRLLKDRAAEFDIRVDPALGSAERDSFKITAENGTAHITGSTGVAASSGVLYYLKYSCNCHVSWEADQLDLPPRLPDAAVGKVAMERYRYYFNICTLSYSTPFWSWLEWERGIDWMALSGVNLPLAPSGQEDSWRRVFRSLGLTDEDLAGFFAGPPFLAWNRMGNIQGWGGPLSQNWMSSKAELNKKIVARMREFGMMAILPAFAGHVPEALQRIYPSANISRLSAWGHFTDPYTRTFFLDPRDPLFKTLGSAYIKEVNKTFGTDHLYSCDPFNEMTPVSSDPAYLAALGASVLSAMTLVDPQAVWVMQGWMFVNDPGFWQPPQAKALLTSVPQGKLLILDLAAEILPQYLRFESFYGQPFIFCMLHNYGGVQGLFGNVEVLMRHLKAARATTTTNITLVGTGMTPEGINQNYVMYDLFTELMWTEGIDVQTWALDYAKRRYGSLDARLGKAWQILMSSVYNSKAHVFNYGQYVLVTRPDVGKAEDKLWYSVSDLVKAWDLIIAVARNSTEHQHVVAILNPLQSIAQEKHTQTVAILNLPIPAFTPSLQYLNELEGYPKEAEMIQKESEGRRGKRSVGVMIERREEKERRGYGKGEGEGRDARRKEERAVVEQNTFKHDLKKERREDEEGGEEERDAEGRKEGRAVTEQDTFKHDLVDITRQMLQLIGGNMALRLIDNYKNGVLLAVRESNGLLQDLLKDMDTLLASSPAFLLGRWVDGATSWATSEQERQQLVKNALHQITIWGPTGEIVDYAIKQWSGVLSHYLRGRWRLFAERLEDSLVSGQPFDQEVFNFEVFEVVERRFAENVNASFPAQPTGNTLDLALLLYTKYRPVFNHHTLNEFEKQYKETTRRMGAWKMDWKEDEDEDGLEGGRR